MITLKLPFIPSGDVSQIDTVGLKKGSVFSDDTKGVVNWNGSAWVGGDGTKLTPLIMSNEDLLFDAVVMQWYLPLDASTVVSCEVNSISYNGQFDETYTPPRFYCSGFIDNITPQIIKLLVVL